MHGDIPADILKGSIKLVNKSFPEGVVPVVLKIAMSPTFKNASPNKENYRLFSVLLHVLKVPERLVYK